MEVRVLLEGSLEKCSTAEDQGRKKWKSRYFVFKHLLTSNARCLEYYKDKNWRKQVPKGVLTLHAGYETSKLHDPKKQYAFDIKSVDHTFRLAALSAEEQDEWLQVLERENIVKSFIVEAEPSEQLFELGAQDKCHLYIANTELRLMSAADGRLLVTWPFTCLRRYMSTTGRFTIEAGRRAPTGEGKFIFNTPQHDEVYKILDSVIKSKAGKPKGVSSSPEKRDKTEPSPSTNTSSNSPPKGAGYDHLMPTFPLPAHATHPNYELSTMQKAFAASPYSAPYGHLHDRGHSMALGSQSVALSRDSEEKYDTISPLSPGDRTTLSDDVFQTSPNESHQMGESGTYDVLERPQSPLRSVPGSDVLCEGRNSVNLPVASTAEGDFYSTIDSGPTSSVRSSVSSQQQTTEDGNFYNTLDQNSTPVSRPVVPVRGSVSSQQQTTDDGNFYNTLDQNSTPVSRPVVPVRGSVPSQQHPIAASDDGNFYNTLDQNSTPVSRPVVPVRGSVPSQQHPVAAPDDGNFYNTLDQNSTPVSRPVIPVRGSVPSQQQPVAAPDDGNFYNTLDQNSTPVSRPVVPVRGSVPSQQQPVAAPDDGNFYNTLDQNSTPVSRPVVPVRGSVPSQQHPAAVSDDGNLYNTLEQNSTPVSRPVVPVRGSVPSQQQAIPDDDNFYSTLDHDQGATPGIRPAVPARVNVPSQQQQQQQQQQPPDDDNLYNTLDHGQSSPPAIRPTVPTKNTMSSQKQTENQLDHVPSGVKPQQHLSLMKIPDTYDTLDHDQLPKHPIPHVRNTKPPADSAQSPKTRYPVKPAKLPKPVKQQQQQLQPDESYSVLDHGKLAGSCDAEWDNTCNTLHHAALGSPTQPVVVPRKCPLDRAGVPGVPAVGSGATRMSNRHSMPDAPCPLDGLLEQPGKGDVSYDQADLGSYATIDYAAISPSKSPVHAPPIPKDKGRPPPKPAPFLPKLRKASAPDILAFRGSSDQGVLSPKKGGRSSLVSNLKASLEAGGLDFTRPRRKPQKPCREDSLAESDIYAEVDETSCRDSVSVKPPTRKAGRSPSVPANPAEDVYEVPDQPCRPKSLQLIKSKQSNKN